MPVSALPPFSRRAPLPSPGRPTRRALFRSAAGVGLAPTVLAAACGAPGPSVPGTDGKPVAATAAARLLWQVRGTPTYPELVKWGLDQFRQQHPYVTVETTTQNVGDVEKTLTMMVAGEGPDIFHAWGHRMWQYAAKGQMVNHNQLVRDLKKADVDDFVDFQWKGLVIPGTNFRFGMPTYINMVVLYYNRTLFQKRGHKEPTADWTHDDYASMLKLMTFQDGEKKVWGGWVQAANFDRFQAHVLMHGGHVVDPRDTKKSALHEAPAQQGLEWLRARYWEDQTLAPLEDARRPGQPGRFEAFSGGHIATLEDGMHGFQGVVKAMGNQEWNIAHVPKGPARRAVLGTTDSWALWKNTKAKDAGWELLKFMTSREWYEQQARIDGTIPSRKSALDSWVKANQEQWPSTHTVNYRVVTDALTTLNYPTVDEIFLCQAEALGVVQPALDALYKTGTKPASVFAEVRTQLDAAAGSCGISFA